MQNMKLLQKGRKQKINKNKYQKENIFNRKCFYLTTNICSYKVDQEAT